MRWVREAQHLACRARSAASTHRVLHASYSSCHGACCMMSIPDRSSTSAATSVIEGGPTGKRCGRKYARCGSCVSVVPLSNSHTTGNRRSGKSDRPTTPCATRGMERRGRCRSQRTRTYSVRPGQCTMLCVHVEERDPLLLCRSFSYSNAVQTPRPFTMRTLAWAMEGWHHGTLAILFFPSSQVTGPHSSVACFLYRASADKRVKSSGVRNLWPTGEASQRVFIA